MKHLFLKWFLFINLIVVAAIFAGYLGVYKEIYEKDSTFISFGIMAVFWITSIYLGSLYFRFDKFKKENLLLKIQNGWFISELFMTWGLLGTLIGFLCLLPIFGSINSIDKNSINIVLSKVGWGAGVALWTTVVGLICSFLTKIQCFYIEQEAQTKKD